MTEEQLKEVNLSQRYLLSKERKILEEYVGKPIENVPEEYREKIARLREFGLGKKEKTLYEQVIEFLENHNGKLMRSTISADGKRLRNNEMTEDQKLEQSLYQRWARSEERKVLEEYVGQPIENVPEEHREKIARLREYGLGTIKGKLSQAKQQRDEAKTRNSQAKELEQEVTEQLKKRGQTHDEQ